MIFVVSIVFEAKIFNKYKCGRKDKTNVKLAKWSSEAIKVLRVMHEYGINVVSTWLENKKEN